MDEVHPLSLRVFSMSDLLNATKRLSCLRQSFALESKLSIYDIGITVLEHICGYGKLPVKLSSNGGITIKIGDYTIRLYGSAHHLLTQMVLFANEVAKKFRCPKSLALKRIISMVATPLHSYFKINDRSPHSPGSGCFNVYAGRLVSAIAQADSFYPGSIISLTPQVWCRGFILDSVAHCIWPHYGGLGKCKLISQQHSGSDIWDLLLTLRRTSPYVELTVAPSPKGGVDIGIGYATIHVPQCFSAHHPLVQMVLFADKYDGNNFYCQKSMAPKIIVDIAETPLSVSCNKYYEAGWISTKTESQSPNAGVSEFKSGESSERSVPVLVDITTKKEISNTVCAIAPTGDGGFVLDSEAHSICQNATETKASNNYQTHCTKMSSDNRLTSARSMDPRTDSSSTPHGQLTVEAGDFGYHRENLHSIGTSAATSSSDTTLVPIVHELGETELEYHSDIDSIAAEAERVIVETEEAKTSATWLVSTATPHHATGNRSFISGFTAQRGELFVHAADGTPMQVLGCGNVVTDAVVLADVWYVPGLTANLVSVSQLAELDYSVGFGRAQCHIRDGALGRLVGSARVGDDGLFELDFLKLPLCM